MQHDIPIWKEAPFIRLFIPFAVGIVFQWYMQLPAFVPVSILGCCTVILVATGNLQTLTRFRFNGRIGIIINLLMLSLGLSLVYVNTIKLDAAALTAPSPGKIYAATISEPLTEKEKSFKANAILVNFFKNDSLVDVNEKFIIYFPKDSTCGKLHYNSRIVFSKPLRNIRESGNPGAFNYRQYCKLQGIRFEIYLRAEDYLVQPSAEEFTCKGRLVRLREKIISILRANIPGEKEAGLAEALLIGFKDDLDKELVQSYTNTGVVHIIAISGLHVGLIYWLTSILFFPLAKRRRTRWIKAVLTVCSLWIFGFVAGGSPSVLRSALMFSFIVTAETTGKRTAVFNSLAASAFLLLCYNPLWLFDAGFQLSYVAVLSILIFMKPVYCALVIKNKLLDLTWKMCALSIAAQVLTTPLSIFMFGQFPNYFLITNLVAVPLSSLVVLTELCLCAFGGLSQISLYFGSITALLIKCMNAFIEHINHLPCSTLQGLQLSLTQLIPVYIGIACCTYWISGRHVHALMLTLVCFGAATAIRSFDLVQSSNQCKLIVYNIPHHKAIDLVEGNSYVYLGDEGPDMNTQFNFSIKPARQLYRVSDSGRVSGLLFLPNGFYFSNKAVLVISALPISPVNPNCTWDVVILSGNANLRIAQLSKTITTGCLVFDSSNPDWKIKKWVKECERLKLNYYAVPEKGAFILNMN